MLFRSGWVGSTAALLSILYLKLLPALIAAAEAVGVASFNLQSIQATTNPGAVWLVFNGPIVQQLAINASGNCLGPGTWANATLGRAMIAAARSQLTTLYSTQVSTKYWLPRLPAWLTSTDAMLAPSDTKPLKVVMFDTVRMKLVPSESLIFITPLFTVLELSRLKKKPPTA